MQPVTVRRWEVVAAFVLLALAFVFSLYLVNRESLKRSNDNRELIVQIQNARRVALARVARTDIYTCEEIERLKTGFRQQAIENFAQLDRNGKLLGVTITPQLRAAALAGLKKTLRRYAGRTGGCGTLPTVKSTNGG